MNIFKINKTEIVVRAALIAMLLGVEAKRIVPVI